MTKKFLNYFLLAIFGIALSAGLALSVKAEDTCNGGLKTYYYDNDRDGYGSSTISVQACSAPQNYVASSSDCNDALATINPGATEICNGLDDNCNGQIDEGSATTTYYLDFDGDDYGSLASTTLACAKPAGYSVFSTDCDDNNNLIFPKAKEVCDSVDNNCNGKIDENCIATSTRIIFYQDEDGDGYGDARAYVVASSAPAGYVLNKKDCNDINADIHPGAKEICDQLDNNCNGTKDEGCSCTTAFCQCDKFLFRNHGLYISCVSHWVNEQRKQQEIKNQEKIKAAHEKAKNQFNKKLDKFWEKMIKQMEKIKERGKGKK